MVSGVLLSLQIKMDLVIDLPVAGCRLEAHVRHADALRWSYDVGLRATSYVLVATERTGRYKTVVSSSFFSLCTGFVLLEVHEALALAAAASFFGISTSASQG